MPAYEDWPTEETTAVHRQPPVEPAPPFTPTPGAPGPPPGRGPDDGIGWGFLIGIVLALIAGGIVAAILLTRHHNRGTTTSVTTTVVRTGAAGTATTTTTVAKTPTTTAGTAPTTTATTSPNTTTTAAAPTTTAASPPPKPATVSVPDVGSGSSRVQGAVDKLASSGLLVTLAYVPNDLPLGTVVAQSPSSGSSAPSGSHVTLNLSEGKGGTASNTVPSVTGRTIPQAVSAVKGAGLRLIFVRTPVSDRSKAGTVISQTPAPGARIPAHGEVLVYMGAAH